MALYCPGIVVEFVEHNHQNYFVLEIQLAGKDVHLLDSKKEITRRFYFKFHTKS